MLFSQFIYYSHILTHQDGQHNVLEVIPQVGGVGAEEDKVALNQLQKSEIKH